MHRAAGSLPVERLRAVDASCLCIDARNRPDRKAGIMSTHDAVSNVTPDPCDVAIGAVLLQATPQWAEVADDKLTHTLETALGLLVRAGLLEQRFSVRAWMDGFPDEVRAVCRVSGDYQRDLDCTLILHGSGWLKDGRTVGAYHSEWIGPRYVRLTVNGERAKADWQAGEIGYLLDFVQRVGCCASRPPCKAEIDLRNCAAHPRTDLAPKEPTPAAPAVDAPQPQDAGPELSAGPAVEPQDLTGDAGHDSPITRRQRQLKWLAEAMLLVKEHPDWPDAEIARRVNKSPSALSRNDMYQAAAKMARDGEPDLLRGHVTQSEDGELSDVEAYAEEKPEWWSDSDD